MGRLVCRAKLAGAVWLLAATGCAVGPDYARPKVALEPRNVGRIVWTQTAPRDLLPAEARYLRKTTGRRRGQCLPQAPWKAFRHFSEFELFRASISACFRPACPRSSMPNFPSRDSPALILCDPWEATGI